MKKKYALAILIFMGLLILIRMVTPEDSWICKDGKWIKHGNPTSAMPTKVCK